ncbi:unnamed protein product, partial [Sphacelaria rigidula]
HSNQSLRALDTPSPHRCKRGHQHQGHRHHLQNQSFSPPAPAPTRHLHFCRRIALHVNNRAHAPAKAVVLFTVDIYSQFPTRVIMLLSDVISSAMFTLSLGLDEETAPRYQSALNAQ